jgi:hypothetical protein
MARPLSQFTGHRFDGQEQHAGDQSFGLLHSFRQEALFHGILGEIRCHAFGMQAHQLRIPYTSLFQWQISWHPRLGTFRKRTELFQQGFGLFQYHVIVVVADGWQRHTTAIHFFGEPWPWQVRQQFGQGFLGFAKIAKRHN